MSAESSVSADIQNFERVDNKVSLVQYFTCSCIGYYEMHLVVQLNDGAVMSLGSVHFGIFEKSGEVGLF